MPGDFRIELKGFRFSGTHLIAKEVLAEELAGYIGRQLTAKDLLSVAQTVATAYLRRGMMARVRIAAVIAAEGVAEVAVEELRVGKVRVEYPADTRIREGLVERFLTDGLAVGSPLPLARLESGIEVLNSQPGIAAAIGLDRGAQAADVDITVHLSDRPVLAGRFFADNHGVREIGQDRLGLDVRIDNVLGLAERLAIDVEQSAGSSLLAPLLSLPLGDSGMRASLQATTARFRARRAGAALELRGQFDRWQASLRQTLLRGQPLALKAEYSLQRTFYHDNSIFGNLQNRRIDAALLRLDGVSRNNAGITRLGLDVERGDADLSRNAGDLAADAASSRIHGGFWRLRWRLGHEMTAGRNNFILRTNGQIADRNLDSTQQFALGGYDGVRAYPTAEALGDGGWLATMEWRHQFDDAFETRVFLDGGGIQRNTKPWTNQRNRYELSGLGAGLSWRLPERLRISLDAARQLGGNAGRNSAGTDGDGRDARWRAWLSMQLDF
ncbi:MAG: ShlB/FhaC/HecB family hemolysin secretion/activation protein [Rhodocyclales bacterium]|nr:ShlB/FhaC/HecB family hemolysin secretion/activation protein [Rhodocyclales bacterium]